jgi:hypothetical protein
MASATTLAEKTYAVVGWEAPSGYTSPIGLAWKTRAGLKKDDRPDWTFVLGVAFGIAWGEDPFENKRALTDRALEAAGEAFKRYTDIDVLSSEAA